MAIEAGADLALDTDGRQVLLMRDALVAAVADGTLPEERLDEGVGRVVALKGEDPVAWTCRPAASAPPGAGAPA